MTIIARIERHLQHVQCKRKDSEGLIRSTFIMDRMILSVSASHPQVDSYGMVHPCHSHHDLHLASDKVSGPNHQKAILLASNQFSLRNQSTVLGRVKQQILPTNLRFPYLSRPRNQEQMLHHTIAYPLACSQPVNREMVWPFYDILHL